MFPADCGEPLADCVLDMSLLPPPCYQNTDLIWGGFLQLSVVREKLVGGIGGSSRIFSEGIAQPNHPSAPAFLFPGLSSGCVAVQWPPQTKR